MASISTPTQLATFSQPHASSSKSHITLSPVVGDHKCAIAAVRGDGVWTYDLSTLRPTTSFTVPPSTVFTSNVISYWSTKVSLEEADEGMEVDEDEVAEGDTRVEKDKISVQEKERVTLVGVGKEVWVWRGEEGDKHVIPIGNPVKSLHHLSSPLYPILVISSSTETYLLDSSLKPQSLTLPGVPRTVLAAKVLSSSASSARLVIVDSEGNVSVSKVSLEENARAERVVEGKIGRGKLVSADVSDDGVISVLDESNNLYSADVPSLSSTTASSLNLVHPSSTPTLLSLPTSGKPLVLLPTSHPTPSVLLAVPLSAVPAVLASTSISSFSASGAISHLSVLSSRGGVITIGVVLNHLNSDGESGRSVIYTCEVIVPPKGVGMAMLLGTKEKTSTYLSTDSSSASNGQAKSESEKRQDEIVDNLSASLKKNDASSAEKKWTEWIAQNPDTNEQFVKRVLGVVFGSALNEEGKLKGPFAAAVVHDLIKRGVVNDSMWRGGVAVDGLLPCGDWKTILIAVETMRTIPSSTLVALLAASLHPASPNTTTPEMSAVLRLILASPPPAPSFRLDLRRGLSVEDATAVLSCLVGWAEEHVSRRSEGLVGWDQAQDRQENAEVEGSLPSLDSTINYSSILLDSHLPSFLTYEPSHELLERLQATLEPLLAIQIEYRQLRGPVEAVLTLARREARKKEEREVQQRSKGRHDRRKGGAAGAEKADKLPEEVVGKWKVEDLVF